MQSILKQKKFLWLLLIPFAVLLVLLWPKKTVVIPTQKVEASTFILAKSVNGSVVAKKTVNLTFQSSGLLTYLAVQKGDLVKPYQTIAVLDQRTVQKNLQQALLDYSKQRNTFDQTLSNNNAQRPEDAVNDAIKRILQDNQYDLDKAVNSVELQDLAKQQSVLTTPIGGIVTRADVQQAGTTITTATTFTITDPTSLEFDMDVDEADIAGVNIGNPVDVVLDPYPDTTAHLQVNHIDFVTHLTSTNGNAYTVSANLPLNTNNQYRVGMNGNAQIITEKLNNVITVPLNSLIDNNKVFLKTASGYQEKTLSLGEQNDTDAVVNHGLTAGDVLVLDPSLVAKQK